MKTAFIVISILFCCCILSDFKTEQKRYARVREAYTDKEAVLKKLYESKQQDLYRQQTYIRVLKQEQLLEVWSKGAASRSFSLIKTYPICAASGTAGPKRLQGDNQVPEGVYYIDRFNPVSSFYLSLGLNYPNASDRMLSDKTTPGGDIFIHGACVSIGCMAMTDDAIKELYLICLEASQNGQKRIPVYIFPCRMTEINMKHLRAEFPQHKKFWNNLQPVFSYWEENHNLPAITVDATGTYQIQ